MTFSQTLAAERSISSERPPEKSSHKVVNTSGCFIWQKKQSLVRAKMSNETLHDCCAQHHHLSCSTRLSIVHEMTGTGKKGSHSLLSPFPQTEGRGQKGAMGRGPGYHRYSPAFPSAKAPGTAPGGKLQIAASPLIRRAAPS